MQIDTRMLEEASLNAHPCLRTVYYDGWYLRFADGYTYRANSVNILQPSTLPLEEKIQRCEAIYFEQGLPALFKITPLSLDVDAALDAMGYVVEDTTRVMTKALPLIGTPQSATIVESGFSQRWQADYFRLNNTNCNQISIAAEMQNRIIPHAFCASIFREEAVVACGYCVVDQGLAGLYGIAVSPQHRRRGYGQDICTALLQAAAERGAKNTYLQVVADNSKAIGLYEAMGYSDLYRYWYRVKPKP